MDALVRRSPPGRNAYRAWLRESLAPNKRLRDIAWEAVAFGGNSFDAARGMAHFAVAAATWTRSACGAGRRHVLEVARAVSATFGNDFFRSLVEHIAVGARADNALTGEFEHNSPVVRTVAVWSNGQLIPNFEYELAGSFSGSVHEGSAMVVPSSARREYPADSLLSRM